MVEKTTWCLSAKNFGSNKRVEPFTQMAMLLVLLLLSIARPGGLLLGSALKCPSAYNWNQL